MTRKFIIIIFLLLETGLCVFGQNDGADEIIKVETTLVSVPVTVSDRQGRFLPNLKAGDFTLLADGKQQKIQFFAATEEPLNIALLIDTSRSTEEVLYDIKGAATDFIKLLKAQDKATIISFDFVPHLLTALTADRERLKRAVGQAEIGEFVGTTLHDAIDEATRALSKIKGRKAIIILTDGKDAGSEVAANNLLYSLQESDAPVYTAFYKTGGAMFGAGSRGGRERDGIFGRRFPNGGRHGGISQRRRERIEQKNAEAEEFLQQLAIETGGRSFSGEVGDLKKNFDSIIDELRFQYRLGFYPPENQTDETTHTLKVRVARPEAVVRARNSYRVQN